MKLFYITDDNHLHGLVLANSPQEAMQKALASGRTSEYGDEDLANVVARPLKDVTWLDTDGPLKIVG